MKKVYVCPVSDFFNFDSEEFLAESLGSNETVGKGEDDEYADGDKAMTNKKGWGTSPWN